MAHVGLVGRGARVAGDRPQPQPAGSDRGLAVGVRRPDGQVLRALYGRIAGGGRERRPMRPVGPGALLIGRQGGDRTGYAPAGRG